jgi:hypothetical protein
MSHFDVVRGTALVKNTTHSWTTYLNGNRSCGLPILEPNILVFVNLQIRKYLSFTFREIFMRLITLFNNKIN